MILRYRLPRLPRKMAGFLSSTKSRGIALPTEVCLVKAVVFPVVTYGLQHARSPCPSPTPGVYSNSCLLSWWCHPVISSSVVAFSSHLQSFPASGSFPMSWFFALHDQSIGVSASASYSGPISFRMGWLDLLAVQRTLKSLLQYHSSKTSILWCSAFFIVQLSHPYVTTGKTVALTWQTFFGKVMSLLFNNVSAFLNHYN